MLDSIAARQVPAGAFDAMIQCCRAGGSWQDSLDQPEVAQ